VTFQEELAARLTGSVVVVGVGNPLRGDDAAGSLLARSLRESDSVRVIDAGEAPESFIGEIARATPDAVAFVDAVDLSRPAGDVALLEVDDVTPYLPSTHRAPLSLVMDVVRSRTGADVFLIAVQPARAGFGAAPSAAVTRTVGLLAGLLAEVLRTPRAAAGVVPPTQPTESLG
jgi:hydrogenase 3 maturation protease